MPRAGLRSGLALFGDHSAKPWPLTAHPPYTYKYDVEETAPPGPREKEGTMGVSPRPGACDESGRGILRVVPDVQSLGMESSRAVLWGSRDWKVTGVRVGEEGVCEGGWPEKAASRLPCCGRARSTTDHMASESTSTRQTPWLREIPRLPLANGTAGC